MNERIRELAVAAGAGEWGDSVIPAMMDIEKFAELIVQECTNVLNRRFMGDLNREDMEVRRCIEDVKKYFKVK